MDEYATVLNEVIEANGMCQAAHSLVRRVRGYSSGHQEKKNGVKYFIEPLKVELTRIYDPVFKPTSIRMHDGPVHAPDYDIETNQGVVEVDYKDISTCFTDIWWKNNVPVEKYVSISATQFERYRMEEPVTLFIERNITDFAPETVIGARNLEAFEFSKKEPRESWHYIWITPEELSSWRLNKQYYHSITRGSKRTKPEPLIVFNLDICSRVWNITKHIPEARAKRVLM